MSDNTIHYTAYVIAEAERKRILDVFPAKFDKIIAHHVTYEFGTMPDQKPPTVTNARIVGCHANDRIQALVVELDDHKFQKAQDDQRYLHLTLSRDTTQNVRNVESNQLIAHIVANHGEKALHNLTEPMAITVEPASLSHIVPQPDSIKNTQKPQL